MKVSLLSGLSAIAVTAAAVQAQALTVSPEVNSLSYTHLAELNQSQTFETLSLAGGVTRLPASAYKTAGVYFITNNKEQNFSPAGMGNEFGDPTDTTCARYGFTVKSCASGLFNKVCPYNDKIYDKCCDATYKYNPSQCTTPKKLSSDTCGGKYKCYCDPATYPYASCVAPQIKGASCTDDSGTRYQTCTCPASVPTPYGCQTYYPSPCGSVCKVAYTDNCRNRASAQTPYGCEKYWDDCDSKCEWAYTDNCRNRNAVPTPYGCKQAWGDCASKCQIAYTDNCRNRTATISSCPANASCSYFSDCATKIQSWSCKSGYVKSGNSCILDNQCPGFEKKASCPNKYYTKEVCSQDNAYIKCTTTCGSRIVDDNPTYTIDGGNGAVTVITKDHSYLPSSGIVYSNVNFPQYPECAALPKPKITLNANSGSEARFSVERLENVDIVVNFTPFNEPEYCYDANSFKASPFCSDNSSDYGDAYCENRNDCISNPNCKEYSWHCEIYSEAMTKYGYIDLCDIAENYDNYCKAPQSPTIGLNLDGKLVRTETYTNNGKSSTRYITEGTYKNVNITVNGNPQIAVKIGGGAHYDKTVKFEGTNAITGGSKYSVWARGHNSYAYGIVRGVLQVNSGARLSLGKEACIYNQWNGVVVRNGTITGTVTQNCQTYKLSL